MTQPTPEEIRKLLSRPEAKQLISILQTHSTAVLKQALDAADAGDTETAKKLLEPILTDPKAAALAQKLGRDLG